MAQAQVVDCMVCRFRCLTGIEASLPPRRPTPPVQGATLLSPAVSACCVMGLFGEGGFDATPLAVASCGLAME